MDMLESHFDRKTRRALDSLIPLIEQRIKNCKVIGLGSGRTVAYLLGKLSEELDLSQLTFVPSSRQILLVAKRIGLKMTSYDTITSVDLTIDGADEVDSEPKVIKGGGGGLIGERSLSYLSSKYVIVVDESKLSSRLGFKSHLPMEVNVHALPMVLRYLDRKGLKYSLKVDERGFPKLSQSGNYLVELLLSNITIDRSFISSLRNFPGVVDVGVFFREEITEVLIGGFDGSVKILSGDKI